MKDTISGEKFMDSAPDEELEHYQQLINTVRTTLEAGPKKRVMH